MTDKAFQSWFFLIKPNSLSQQQGNAYPPSLFCQNVSVTTFRRRQLIIGPFRSVNSVTGRTAGQLTEGLGDWDGIRQYFYNFSIFFLSFF
jgi:hypothetical protein